MLKMEYILENDVEFTIFFILFDCCSDNYIFFYSFRNFSHLCA